MWVSLRKLGVDEWIIRLIKAMYSNVQSSVQVNGSSSEPFKVTGGVHQESTLSPLLFIIVMEALSREFRFSCPWELLYAEDLSTLNDSLADLKNRLADWKTSPETHGLRANVGKTEILVSCAEHNQISVSNAKYSCGVCIPLVVVLTPSYRLCVICGFIISCSGETDCLTDNRNFVSQMFQRNHTCCHDIP